MFGAAMTDVTGERFLKALRIAEDQIQNAPPIPGLTAAAAGSFSSSAAPNKRSNTARGLISGGLGVFSVRHEMLLLEAQL
jgi:hypothetical protein